MADLSVTIGNLTLKNPVLAAAGTFGYGIEFAGSVPIRALGGLVSKTLTLNPRPGNPPPRLFETPSGMLNAVGLQNAGLEDFLAEKLPEMQALGPPVIVSVLANSPDEVAAMAARLDAVPGAAGIELNLSCPNVKHGEGADAPPGAPPALVAQDPEATRRMVEAARGATKKPLIAKLAPDVTDIAPIALAAESAGADALTIANTFIGMHLDVRTGHSSLGRMTGGLSGPAIRPLALYRVWYTAQHVRVPVIGLGGIAKAEDALEFLLAGASAVAVGTAHFADPKAAVKILKGIETFFQKQHIGRLSDYVGTLKEP